VIPQEHQEDVVAMLLYGSTVDLRSLSGSTYRHNPFLAFCQLFSLRWKANGGKDGVIPSFVDELSKEVHDKLYGIDGIYPKQENGCSEDHQVCNQKKRE
jgi:hypothetical protein